MAAIAFLFLIFSIFCLDNTVYASECCKAYTDNYGVRQDEEWCPDYCCDKTYILYTPTTPDLECCSSSFRRADSYRRSINCNAWWSQHAWVPVLISIGCIAAITLCCFGCFKLCSNNNNRTGMMIQQPQAPAVIMVSGQHPSQPQYPSSSVQNQAVYPPVGFNPAPPPYDTGVPPKSNYPN